MDNSIFKEEQKFPLWIYLLTLMPAIIMVGLSVSFYLENNSEAIKGLAFGFIAIIAINLLIYVAKLKTKIDYEGIHIKFAPLTNRKILWKDIEKAEIVKYGFVGYGWRLSFKYGRVYNTKGNKGLFIITKNKKKILIGTQQPEKLKIIVENYQDTRN